MIASENFASDSYEKSQHCVRTIIWMPVDFVLVDAIVSVSWPMSMSVNTCRSLNLAPGVIIDAKARNTFSSLTRNQRDFDVQG